MRAEELIESIKVEYSEIHWKSCQETYINDDGSLILDIPNRKLYEIYKNSENFKNLVITRLCKSENYENEYIIITEIFGVPRVSVIDIGENDKHIEINRNLDKSLDKFIIEHSFFRSYFIKVDKKRLEDYNFLQKIIMFKNLEEFRNALKIELLDWDDYGFKQTINITIWNNLFTIRINPRNNMMIKYLKGEVNELQKDIDLEKISNFSNYKDKREYLEKVKCSLGTEGYYNFLKKYLPYNIREEWFKLTNDLAFNIDLLDNFRLEVAKEYYSGQRYTNSKENNDHFLFKSFFRSTTVNDIKNVFHPLTKFRGELEEDIIYNFIDEGIDKGRIVFSRPKANNLLPMRIYGIVGANGTGKSYRVNEIIKRHLENNGNSQYSQILHFSLSPFDDLVKYNIDNKENVLSDIVYVQNEEINEIVKITNGVRYEKIGISLIRRPLINNILDKAERLKLNDIKKFIEEKYKDILNNGKLAENVNDKITVRDSFIWYIQDILMDLISDDNKYKLWQQSLDYFSFESWVSDIQGLFTKTRKIKIENFKKLTNLSSGQATILLFITKLVNSINQRSLIIFDEPETFMHPPMMKAFIRAVSDVTENKNAFCLVATHSPVIVQEIPHCNLYKLNSDYEIKKISYKTYGENLDTLYKNIYGVEFQNTGYNELLVRRSNEVGVTANTLLNDDEIKYLGGEAYLRYILLKNQLEKRKLEEEER